MKQNFSSKQFLSKLKNKDNESVTLLVKEYTSHLMNASYGLGLGESDSEELVQSVWSAFFQNLSRFEGRSHIRTYIFGIFYNKSKELRRDRNKYTSSTPFEDIMEDKFDLNGNWIQEPMGPEKFLEQSESIDIINNCIEKLPLQQRMAFNLKQVEELKAKEICNILDVSNTNLGVLIYRAKNKLRECIERNSK